jgi:hypothetical protein
MTTQTLKMRNGILILINLLLLLMVLLLQASYGTAFPKAHADTTWSQDDEDAGDLPDDKSVGDIKTRGLKYNLIQTIKQQASGLLAPTDWYVVKASEVC